MVSHISTHMDFRYLLRASSAIALTVLLRLPVLAQPFPGTQLLNMEGDLAAQMVSGIDTYLDAVLAEAPKTRAEHWARDLSSAEAYAKSITTNRQRLATILGVVDKRDPVVLRSTAPFTSDAKGNPAEIGRGKGFKILSVSWNVFRGVEADGLLLMPDGEIKASVVALPDCDWTPEQLVGLQPGVPAAAQFARKLAEDGCRVIVPCLVDRSDTHSGLPGVRKLKQSQREVLWRASYEMGRTIQGYEVQKVLAAVDWLASQPKTAGSKSQIAVVGYGEGGLIACFAGALDPRIDLTAVSGYHINPNLHDEPIYRNVWAITEEFGAGELVGLIAPRTLVWENGQFPETEYPKPGQPHNGAAPGKLGRPNPEVAKRVLDEARGWLKDVPGVDRWKLVGGQPEDIFNIDTLATIEERLELSGASVTSIAPISAVHPAPDHAQRSLRQYSQILEDTQWLMREGEYTRAAFWKKADRKNATTFAESSKWYRDYFLNEIVGPIPAASVPANPRSRKVSETDKITCYEVVLDVHPHVFAYGILVVPKGIKPARSARWWYVSTGSRDALVTWRIPRSTTPPTTPMPAAWPNAASSRSPRRTAISEKTAFAKSCARHSHSSSRSGPSSCVSMK
jgi:dienelactone hydrolase